MATVVLLGSDGYFFSSAWGFEESFCKAETLDLVLKDNRRVSGLDQTLTFPSCLYVPIPESYNTGTNGPVIIALPLNWNKRTNSGLHLPKVGWSWHPLPVPGRVYGSCGYACAWSHSVLSFPNTIP